MQGVLRRFEIGAVADPLLEPLRGTLERPLRRVATHGQEVDLLAVAEVGLARDDLLPLGVSAQRGELRLRLRQLAAQLRAVDRGQHVAALHLRAGFHAERDHSLRAREERRMERRDHPSLHGDVALQVAAGDGRKPDGRRIDRAVGARPAPQRGKEQCESDPDDRDRPRRDELRPRPARRHDGMVH